MGKCIIYLRTSTKEQEPQLQLNSCLEFCKQHNLEVIEVISEQQSAYKERERKEWKKVLEKSHKDKLDIVLFRYDRSFRNRKEFFEFMKIMFEVYGVKVYSTQEPSILTLWDMIDKSYTENPVINEFIKGIFKTLWDLLIQQAGEQGEEESRKRSQRTKLAVIKQDGQTLSYKGKKWGRKGFNEKIRQQVRDLHSQNYSIRDICLQVYYYDKNNNKKPISKSSVHKILNEKKEDIIHK